jgi:hypothetical protein
MGLMHTQGIVLLSLALGGIQIQTLLLAATANRTASAPKAQRRLPDPGVFELSRWRGGRCGVARP